MKIAYQGIEGSYSSLAAHKYAPEAERSGYPTFAAVIDAVQKNEVTHALLPIENSTAGRVADLHHLLSSSDLTIIDEYFLPVQHALIGLKTASLSDISQAYSHREALAQCTHSLNKLDIESVSYGDTAKAVLFVSETENKNFAAIASTYSATLYDNVHVLKKGMQDVPDNVTRFLILTKKPAYKPLNGDCITSVVYDVLDAPSALYDSLGAFAENQINIIKLESFVPMQRHKKAHFYLECIGSPQTNPLKEALAQLEKNTKRMRILGTYKKSPYRSTFEQ